MPHQQWDVLRPLAQRRHAHGKDIEAIEEIGAERLRLDQGREIAVGRGDQPRLRALLATVAHLLDLELDVTPFEAAVRAFRTQCDQAVAQDAAVQAYVRQLEQDYDATGDEAPRPRRDDDFNPDN